jgi:hypothetical protein
MSMWNSFPNLLHPHPRQPAQEEKKCKRLEDNPSQPTKQPKREPLDDISNTNNKSRGGGGLIRVEKSTKVCIFLVTFLKIRRLSVLLIKKTRL